MGLRASDVDPKRSFELVLTSQFILQVVSTNSSNGYMCQRRNWLIHKADFVLCTVSQFCNAIQMMQSTLPKAGGKILFQIESKLTQSKLNQMLDTHTVQLYI